MARTSKNNDDHTQVQKSVGKNKGNTHEGLCGFY
jgi:hypothetical protein